MIDRLSWLAIDVADLDVARSFYEDILNLPDADAPTGEHRLTVGESELHLRGPDADRDGGRHVHYAFETGPESLGEWESRLGRAGTVQTHDFGVYRSLYVFDPDDHCVEVGGRADNGDALSGIFEIVLQVEVMEAAESFYADLGCDVIDRGDDRRRVRMDAGPFELELWEPQTGLASAEPGEHVELGLAVETPPQAVQRAQENGAELDGLTESTVIDPAGHRLVFVPTN